MFVLFLMKGFVCDVKGGEKEDGFVVEIFVGVWFGVFDDRKGVIVVIREFFY